MNNDLISREYMKKAIEQFFVREKYYHPYSKGRKTIPTEEVLDIIDTAPTVEEKSYAMGYQDGSEDGLDGIRPHGKWIDESRDSLLCTCCNKRVYKPFIGGFPTERSQHYYPNFCAFCGADMRKGGVE